MRKYFERYLNLEELKQIEKADKEPKKCSRGMDRVNFYFKKDSNISWKK